MSYLLLSAVLVCCNNAGYVEADYGRLHLSRRAAVVQYYRPATVAAPVYSAPMAPVVHAAPVYASPVVMQPARVRRAVFYSPATVSAGGGGSVCGPNGCSSAATPRRAVVRYRRW